MTSISVRGLRVSKDGKLVKKSVPLHFKLAAKAKADRREAAYRKNREAKSK